MRPRIFPSLCDPFEDWKGPIVDKRANGTLPRAITMNDLRRHFFGLIDKTPNLDWLLLTKRPENIMRMWPLASDGTDSGEYDEKHLHNVWLLYSASDQETLEAGLHHLLACRDLAPVLGMSLEPLLGPVDLTKVICESRECEPSSSPLANDWTHLWMDALTGFRATSMFSATYGPQLDWVIVGGESGPDARPCALEWIDDIRRQCQTSGVPCFIKQLGSNPVTTNANLWDAPDLGKFIGASWGNTVAGCRINLDDPKGGDPSAWPEDLRVREFPR
jgi:protein gp37